ncbi:MAG: LLM class flavin-dependent oxidoreductase [Eubacteriales bacterium]|nr:LLM class flavin-dependent oxidoreductase [Eubacteriales bacterium]
MSIRNEIKAKLVEEGVTMQEVLNRLKKRYCWSNSISNLSGKLGRESLRYKEVIELADVLGYDIIWVKRR